MMGKKEKNECFDEFRALRLDIIQKMDVALSHKNAKSALPSMRIDRLDRLTLEVHYEIQNALWNESLEPVALDVIVGSLTNFKFPDVQ